MELFLLNLSFLLAVAVIIVLISISWTQVVGAPWLPTPRRKVKRMLELAELQPDELLYDLGCGDGRVIIMAARKFNARAVGIELDPLRYLWCQMLVSLLGLRGRVDILYGNFFKYDLSRADVVTCYLLQSTNDRLEEKLIQEVKSRGRVVSHSFTFDRLTLEGVDKKEDLYCYRL
jgi:SAM-dependent methyltransferase